MQPPCVHMCFNTKFTEDLPAAVPMDQQKSSTDCFNNPV